MLWPEDPRPSDSRSKEDGQICAIRDNRADGYFPPGSRYLFPSRLHARPHLSTRQYSRLVHRWVDSIGLESISYGTQLRIAMSLVGTFETCPPRPKNVRSPG